MRAVTRIGNSHSEILMATPARALSPRKVPKQKRSQETVEAILTAAARVLVESGYDKASTNRIAKVAGVSVGSLYQYFPSKEALVMALFERHAEKMVGLLEDSVRTLIDTPLRKAVREYVKSVLATHRMEPQLHAALVQQALHVGIDVISEVQERACAIVRVYLEQHREEILPTNLEMAAHMLVTTVESVIHGTLLHHPELIESPSFEREVVALILRYLTGSDAD
jgi:AcrR family transcriptional regulator